MSQPSYEAEWYENYDNYMRETYGGETLVRDWDDILPFEEWQNMVENGDIRRGED